MKLLHILLAVSLSVAPVSATYPEGLPDLGDSSEAAFSGSQEQALGARIMRDIRADRSYIDDPELTGYLNSLGRRLSANAGPARQDFEFFLLDDNTLNAFALPGGYIGVHSGLILAAQSESELASVLGHEIAHVTQRHLARMLSTQNQTMLTSLAALAVAILAARSNSQLSEAALATAQAASIQSQLDYTRAHEREADRVGLQTLDKAGFDTRAMAMFFERLQKSSRTYDYRAPVYLRTHPLTTERIADIQNRLSTLPVHAVADNSDFQLVRAKLRAMMDSPKEAVEYFEKAGPEAGFGRGPARAYGLAAALVRARDYPRAQRELDTLRKSNPPHPMLEGLAARSKREAGDPKAAQEIYRGALKQFPQSRALFYGYMDALLDGARNSEALKAVSDRLVNIQDDYRLYELQAKSYAALGKKLPQHAAQAEAYARQGNLPAAIEQLQIGLKSGDGDFYQLSSAESRLKELKLQAAADKPRQ